MTSSSHNNNIHPLRRTSTTTTTPIPTTTTPIISKPETKQEASNPTLQQPPLITLTDTNNTTLNKLQFNDIPCLESDEILSFVSSDTSFKDPHQRQFYTRTHLQDNNDIASTDSNTAGNRFFLGNPTNAFTSNHVLTYTNYTTQLDDTSTFSGSILEDNVSTKPLISYSSDEEEESKQKERTEEEEEDDEGDDHASIQGNVSRKVEHDSIDYLEHEVKDDEDDEDDEDDNDYIDQCSFDVRSKCEASTRSTAITSLSILTHPALATINSSTTGNTAAASVMTLASSSRHVH